MNVDSFFTDITVPNSFGQFNNLPLADKSLALDMMANTGCSYGAVCSAFAIWHAMGVEGNDRYFDSGKAKRSLKIGHGYGGDDIEWIVTVK
jgi:hypothetical protein